MKRNKQITMDHRALNRFIRQALISAGFNDAVADAASHVLVLADLRGIDSHGAARLKGYLRQVRQGRIDPGSKPSIIHETPSTATLDAHKGLGLSVAQQGMKIAIEKARNVGSGWTAIKNSSHFGIAYAHTALALEEDMIGFAVTNASPLVAPSNSVQAMLGTNPVCFTIPAGDENPVVADMASTVVANGKLEIATREGKRIPEGWVQSKDGAASDDPQELKNGGTLLPLGSDPLHGDHKGFCLGSVVDILSGVLPGASFGPWVPPFVAFLDEVDRPTHVGEGIGHFVGAWRVDAFRPAPEFKDSMDTWIKRMRQAKAAPGRQVQIPGDPEWRMEETRKKDGIPLNERVYEDLEKIGQEYGISLNDTTV